MVVLGRGVGFGQLPYELTDMSVVYRTFYDVDPKYFDVVGSLPQDVVLASADIIEQAEISLGCDLNPNLPWQTILPLPSSESNREFAWPCRWHSM